MEEGSFLQACYLGQALAARCGDVCVWLLKLWMNDRNDRCKLKLWRSLTCAYLPFGEAFSFGRAGVKGLHFCSFLRLFRACETLREQLEDFSHDFCMWRPVDMRSCDEVLLVGVGSRDWLYAPYHWWSLTLGLRKSCLLDELPCTGLCRLAHEVSGEYVEGT